MDEEEQRIEVREVQARQVGTNYPDCYVMRVAGQPSTYMQSWMGAFYDSWDDEAQQVHFHNKASTPLLANVGDYICKEITGDFHVIDPTSFSLNYYSS